MRQYLISSERLSKFEIYKRASIRHLVKERLRSRIWNLGAWVSLPNSVRRYSIPFAGKTSSGSYSGPKRQQYWGPRHWHVCSWYLLGLGSSLSYTVTSGDRGQPVTLSLGAMIQRDNLLCGQFWRICVCVFSYFIIPDFHFYTGFSTFQEKITSLRM